MEEKFDCAIVLGAATTEVGPSPVFAARLTQASRLFREGKVGHLIVTGGKGDHQRLSEAEVGRDYLVGLGIRPEAITIETRSRTTRENLVETRSLLKSTGFRSVLLVSDASHLKRACLMAADLGLAVAPCALPRSGHRSHWSRLKFEIREVLLRYLYLWSRRR